MSLAEKIKRTLGMADQMSAALNRMQALEQKADHLVQQVSLLRETLAHTYDSVGAMRTSLTSDLHSLRQGVARIEERQLSALSGAGSASSEFKIYSQWGEDGIIQHLLRHVDVPRKVFVEFGVESYAEANTRWLLTGHNWSGLVLDGSETYIAALKSSDLYWQHNLKAVQAFVNRDNINELLSQNGVTGEIGLLSVDVDGVDYWIWEAITVISPAIIIVEYNSLFGPDRAVTVPYDPEFVRGKAHYSFIYYGASLAALVGLGKKKGYAFVGSNSAGNNAFFVRRDLLRSPLRELASAEGFVRRSFREARDESGRLVFADFEREAAIIRDLPLVEVEG